MSDKLHKCAALELAIAGAAEQSRRYGTLPPLDCVIVAGLVEDVPWIALRPIGRKVTIYRA
jgi:hypothetical protein